MNLPLSARLPGVLDAAPLTAQEAGLLKKLYNQLTANSARNRLRTLYYDGERSLRRAGELGMSMPPQLGKLESVIGWPAKAVEVLDNRLDLEGFVVSGQAETDGSLDEIVSDNDLIVESSQTHIASMTHGVAFATVSAGDPLAGEPPVIVQTRSALDATALWSQRSRCIVAGLTVNRGVEGAESDEVCLWLPDATLSIIAADGGLIVHRIPHNLGRVPMVMLPYRPRLGKAFGMSRISRPLMDATDAAARTIIRMEGTAEFFSFPQRYALNVHKDDFEEDVFATYLNRLLTLAPPEDGGPAPQMGTFAAASPEPHIAQLRALATLVSGETGIPPNALGIIHDNPSSADAIRAAEAELVKIAERAQVVYGHAWCEVMRIAQQLRDGTPDDRLAGLRAQWRDPSTPTKAANAQMVFSLVSAGILPAQSEVTWELLGLDRTTISRLKAHAAAGRARDRIDKLLLPPRPEQEDDETATDDEDSAERAGLGETLDDVL